MTDVETVAAPLADELGGIVGPGATAIGPTEAIEWVQRVEQAAPRLAVQLVHGDDRLLAQTVIDVMCALWPHGSPEQVGRADWWRTPLGQCCARSLATDDAVSVTHSVAAAMLGVARGSIGVMVQRGELLRHPDGGVLRASVLQRSGRRG